MADTLTNKPMSVMHVGVVCRCDYVEECEGIIEQWTLAVKGGCRYEGNHVSTSM